LLRVRLGDVISTVSWFAATISIWSGKPSGIPPDVQKSAATLQQEIEKHYVASGLPIPPGLADMITLAHNLASIVVPLFADILSTFTNPDLT
jgi:hypothetical protein